MEQRQKSTCGMYKLSQRRSVLLKSLFLAAMSKMPAAFKQDGWYAFFLSFLISISYRVQYQNPDQNPKKFQNKKAITPMN